MKTIWKMGSVATSTATSYRLPEMAAQNLNRRGCEPVRALARLQPSGRVAKTPRKSATRPAAVVVAAR